MPDQWAFVQIRRGSKSLKLCRDSRQDDALVALHADEFVHRMRNDAVVTHVVLGADHEKNPALMDSVQSREVEVSTVHDVDGPGLYAHLIQDMRDSLKKACKAAKIKYGRSVRDGFVFLDLRHTFTTNARRAGIPEGEIMAITGHTSRSTFDRYSTVDENDLRRAIERLEVLSASVEQNVEQAQKRTRPKSGNSLYLLDFIYGAEGRKWKNWPITCCF